MVVSSPFGSFGGLVFWFGLFFKLRGKKLVETGLLVGFLLWTKSWFHVCSLDFSLFGFRAPADPFCLDGVVKAKSGAV